MATPTRFRARPGLAGMAFIALMLAATAALPAGKVTDEVSVAGAVKTAMTLKLDDLKGFAPDQVLSATVTRRVDDKEVSSSVRGVRLTAILDRAALANKERFDWRHTIVLASASDGYKVSFSWAELFNTDIGAGVLVVFERDGRPLDDQEGNITLVSTRDQKTGPRHVRWLQRIEVRVLE
jgi:DMSO/TMAO reductase YedYZ molybdopterin-dependent catalytic subunit